jgi:predicted nucleic acid-binding protein
MASIQALLDTGILIDLWRGKSQALAWLESQKATTFGLPVVVCMELVDGTRNNRERERAVKLLANYPIIHLTITDSAWAKAHHTSYRLSHNVGILDALIAAPAVRLRIPMYTLNVKHFAPLPDLQVINPY